MLKLKSAALQYLFLASLLFLTIVGCRKQETSFENDFLITQFFTLPSSSDPELIKVAAAIKKEETQHRFLSGFISKNGLPAWKYTLSNVNRITPNTHSQRGTNNDSLIFYIPFKKLNSQEINSYIVCLKVDTNYSFQLYRKSDIASCSTSDTTKKEFLKSALSVFAYFEKQINAKDSLYIDGLYRRYFSNTSISFRNTYSSTGRTNRTEDLYTYSISVCYKISCGEVQTRSMDGPFYCYECDTYWYVVWGGGGNDGSGNGWWENGVGGGSNMGYSTTVEYLITTLNLNSSQIEWINPLYYEADVIYQMLQESLNQDPIGDNIFPTIPSESAVVASRITIDAMMNNFFNGPYDLNTFNSLIVPYFPNLQSNAATINPAFWFYFSLQCAILKAEHPDWSGFKVWLYAMGNTISELVHTGLDIAGLVPGIGEIADLTNGVIYTLQGDGLNAALSYSAAIPIAGWGPTAAKYANKLITALDGTSRTLKWMKRTDGIIEFGNRNLLRKVLGLPKGDPRVAHHIIPWGKATHPAVQKAAQGGDPFHLNELLNGVPLSTVVHSGNHIVYNSKVQARLDAIPANLNPAQTRQKIEELINDIKLAIQTFPNTHVDNLIF